VPKYLLETSYTVDGVKGVVAKGGSAREAAAKAAIESVGGKMEAFYFAFGATDVVVIFDAPDNEAAAALGLTLGASGAVSAKTTVLLTPAEIDNATSKKVGYTPPGK
jgi:uncharacterized protein with GYD domain